MYRVLIAEDDADIAELVRLYLSSEDYDVVMAGDGGEAYRRFKETKIDLAIVDLMMPVMNGYDLIRKMRETSTIPVIILSAKNQNLDKIVGFNAGADAYLTKPFDPLELVANVKAVMRRYYQFGGAEETYSTNTRLQVQDLVLDLKEMTLKQGDRVIPLTNTEIKLLSKLMQEPGRVFTREQIAESIRSDYIASDEGTIAVHISNLRSKVEQDPAKPRYIKTVRGLGYKIEK